MTQFDWSETVVVLDLDDTLYKEADYQDSGLREVCQWIEDLYGKDIHHDLLVQKKMGEKDLLGAACALAGLPFTVKESLLWIYRLHEPKIHLSPKTRGTVEKIAEASKILAILTDGRSVSQRIKIRALGLANFPVYISEDYASEKPMPHRFRQIMQDHSAKNYIYVGDNPAKDFVAPKTLGWTTFCLLGDHRNIHPQFSKEYADELMPDKWIENLSDIFDQTKR